VIVVATRSSEIASTWSSAVPPPVSLGDVINLYGTTIAAGLTPTAVQVIGYCNPDFGC
jgi:hypothetical protein